MDINYLSEKFLGKICTILTKSSTLPLKDAIQHSQYFTGEVRRIDEFGIWVKHLNAGTLAFFTFPLIGIVEEQHIAPDDPRHSQVKEEIDKVTTKKKPVSTTPPNFISVDELMSSIKRKNS